MGRRNVKQNVVLKDGNGNVSQIDITYGLFRTFYVECKDYKGSIGLEHISKFASVLELNGIPRTRGLFVVNGPVTPRVKTLGIRVLDENDLETMRRRAEHYNNNTKKGLPLFYGLILLGVSEMFD